MCCLDDTDFYDVSQDVSELFLYYEIMSFFFSSPTVFWLHCVASLWFCEWNVMICICIKVLSLDAPSALKTFMEVNLGKKFFAMRDIFFPLYFSGPRFMWKDYT